MSTPETLPQRWIYALKPASWPKLLVPMLLGQGLGLAAGERHAALGGFAFGLVFTLLDLIFIVLLNDWFDRDVDALKRRMFPQSGSPKTIPDGILPPWHLLCAGLLAAALAALVSLAAGLALHPGLFPDGISCRRRQRQRPAEPLPPPSGRSCPRLDRRRRMGSCARRPPPWVRLRLGWR